VIRRHERGVGWPQVTIERLLLDRPVNLLEEGIDLAVRIGPLLDSTMVAMPAGSMRTVVVASPDMLRETGVPQAPAELWTRLCVAFQGVGGWLFRVDGKPMQVSITPRVSVNQALQAAATCAADLGFGCLFEYQVRELVNQGRLTVILEDFELPPQPVSLLTIEARLVTSRLRLLRSALTAVSADGVVAN